LYEGFSPSDQQDIIIYQLPNYELKIPQDLGIANNTGKRNYFFYSLSFGLESISFFNYSSEIQSFGILKIKNGGDWLFGYLVIGFWILDFGY
jgi:hypothetical protein